MNRLDQLVERVKQQGAREFVIVPGGSPRYLSRAGWRNLEDDITSPAQASTVALSLLSPEEKDQLTNTGLVKGSVFSKKGYSISYQVQATWSGHSAHFEVVQVSGEEMEGLIVPEALKQATDRKQGLILVTGPRRSGKTAVLSRLLTQINQTQSAVVMTFSDHPHFLRSSETSSIINQSYPAMGNESIFQRTQMADVIILDPIRNSSDALACVKFLEQGKLVIATMENLTLASCFKSLNQLFDPDYRPLATELLAQHLQVATSLRLMPGQEEPSWALASEILVGTPEVRQELIGGDWKKLSELMGSRGEKTGMQTLNQSLLQLLLRRRISLQTAYEMSPDVEELHNLMEKVGV